VTMVELSVALSLDQDVTDKIGIAGTFDIRGAFPGLAGSSLPPFLRHLAGEPNPLHPRNPTDRSDSFAAMQNIVQKLLSVQYRWTAPAAP
jgi:hypothetical protein